MSNLSNKEKFQLYMQGWKTGARGGKPDPTKKEYVSYQSGFHHGKYEKDEAARRAMIDYPHERTSLRSDGLISCGKCGHRHEGGPCPCCHDQPFGG